MTERPDGLPDRLDRLEAERRARAAGLPAELAERVAEVVSGSGLSEDRRSEVFRELVAHFEDGLTAGRSPAELAASFGDGNEAARMIRSEKRTVTPPELGGSGRSDGWMTRIGRDIRYAARRLLARPAFTAIALASLAVGIGANAAMFTVVNEVILRRPPVKEPERLINIYRSTADNQFEVLTYPDYRDLTRLTDVFESVMVARMGATIRQDGDRADRLVIQLVSGNYFEGLGVRSGAGRLIQPSDAPAPGEGTAVVLTDSYWNRAFGRSPAAIGQTVRLAGSVFTIVGVAPPGFAGAFPSIGIDLFAPVTALETVMPPSGDEFETRSNYAYFVQARLGAGVSVPQALAALGGLAASNREQHVTGWTGQESYTVLPSREVLLYPPIDRLLKPVALVMMAVVGMVLLIACANLAGFLLARAVDRRKEVAVRLAIGATRAQLVGQLLVETVLMAVIGGVAGLILGRLALHTLLAADLPIPLPIDLDLALDGRVLAFFAAITVLAGLAFGLAPALQSTRLELASVIRDESTGGGRAKGRLRRGLVIAQVAVSVVLLIAAGMFVNSVRSLRSVDPGFGAAPADLVWVGTSARRAPEDVVRESDLLVTRLQAVPGTEGVGRTDNMHLDLLNQSTAAINVDGVEPPPGLPSHSIDRAGIDTGFVAAAGLRLIEGRNFTAAESDTAYRVAIVNEAFVAKFWPGQSGVGKRLRRDDRELEVVGVVATAKIRNLAEAPRPFIYEPLRDYLMTWYVVRGADDRLPALVREVRAVDEGLFVADSRSMARHFQIMTLPLELGASALGTFALLALILSSVGLYGTVSYSVAQRSREVGIRLSLGASGSGVIRLLLVDGLKLVAIGAVTGLVLGVLFGRVLEGILFGVRAMDPGSLLAVPAVLLVVAFIAAYLPARRAGRIAPVSVLKAGD